MAGEWGDGCRPSHRREKALLYLRCKSPFSPDSREDGSTPSLTFPSSPTQGHYIARLEELMEFIWVVQRGLEVLLVYTNTHTNTHILSDIVPEVDTVCMGPPDFSQVRISGT